MIEAKPELGSPTHRATSAQYSVEMKDVGQRSSARINVVSFELAAVHVTLYGAPMFSTSPLRGLRVMTASTQPHRRGATHARNVGTLINLPMLRARVREVAPGGDARSNTAADGYYEIPDFKHIKRGELSVRARELAERSG